MITNGKGVYTILVMRLIMGVLMFVSTIHAADESVLQEHGCHEGVDWQELELLTEKGVQRIHDESMVAGVNESDDLSCQHCIQQFPRLGCSVDAQREMLKQHMLKNHRPQLFTCLCNAGFSSRAVLLRRIRASGGILPPYKRKNPQANRTVSKKLKKPVVPQENDNGACLQELSSARFPLAKPAYDLPPDFWEQYFVD